MIMDVQTDIVLVYRTWHQNLNIVQNTLPQVTVSNDKFRQTILVPSYYLT